MPPLTENDRNELVRAQPVGEQIPAHYRGKLFSRKIGFGEEYPFETLVTVVDDFSIERHLMMCYNSMECDTIARQGETYMKKLSIREARQSLSHLDQILAVEGEVTITRRGREIARVVPFGKNPPMPSHRDLRGKMSPMTKGSEDLVREDRDAR